MLLKLFQVLEFQYFQTRLDDATRRPKQEFQIANYLLGKEVRHDYLDTDSDTDLTKTFAQFFETKVQTIYRHFSKDVELGNINIQPKHYQN